MLRADTVSVCPGGGFSFGLLLLLTSYARLSSQVLSSQVLSTQSRSLQTEFARGGGKGTPTLGLRGGGVHELGKTNSEGGVRKEDVMARIGEDEAEWDIWAYNDAMKKSHALPECMTLLKRLEAAEVTPNAVTYHAILDCALHGSIDHATAACDIFERIPKALRSHHTYASAIRLYAASGRAGQTARLLAEAKSQNIAPDPDMIAASMEAQMAVSSQVSEGGLRERNATSAGGSGRRMSKAERRKAKRRSERASNSDEEIEQAKDEDDGKDFVDMHSHTRQDEKVPNTRGEDGEANGGKLRAENAIANPNLPPELNLSDLLQVEGEAGEDVEADDDDVHAPPPLTEKDINWGEKILRKS